MKKYKLVTKKGEGTFSEVVKAQNIANGSFHAIKCMKENYTSVHKVNNLREIQALRRLSPHPNIIDLEEVLFDQPTGRLAMVFELMDKNLYDLICGRRDHLDPKLTTSLAGQLFTALDHIHDRGIFHRDIKPENILVDQTAKVLKLADFGSCRGTNSKKPFTGYIATRWYRAPECLLTNGYYGSEMDIWGAGSVLFELISLYPLFPGSDEIDQLNRIHKVVGTPPPAVLMNMKLKNSFNSEFHFPTEKGVGIRHFIPHAPSCCVSFISQTLVYDHTLRINAKEALRHPYFDELKLNLSDEPDLVSEATDSSTIKSIRKERKKIESKKIEIEHKHPLKKIPQEPSLETVKKKLHEPSSEPLKKNLQGPPSERERKPKRSKIQNHTKIHQEKSNSLKPRHKIQKVKPRIESRIETSKATNRRHRPAPKLPAKLPAKMPTKLPAINKSRVRNTHQANDTKPKGVNPSPQVPKITNKRFGHVKSSGYGSVASSKVSCSPYTNESSIATVDSRKRQPRMHPQKPTRLPPIIR